MSGLSVFLYLRRRYAGASTTSSDRISEAYLRARISLWMLVGSLILLGLLIGASMLAVILQGLQFETRRMAVETSERLLTTLLPVIGTWVGTILAFYFSKENFEAASRAQERILDSTVDRLRRIPATSAMKAFGRIKGVRKLEAQDGEAKTPVAELIGDLNLPEVNRLIFVDPQERVRYVLHESVVYRDMALNGLEKTDGGGNPAPRTLADLLGGKLEDGSAVLDLAKSFAILPLDASLADCQAAMERNRLCRDVFLTRGGGPDKPEGWVTDQDIREKAKA